MKEGRASETAQLIALATVMLDSDPARRHLVAPGAADLSRLLLRTRQGDHWMTRAFTSGLGRRFWRLAESFSWRGISEHFWHRKQWLEAQIRGELGRGCGRVVIAGAGFDT